MMYENSLCFIGCAGINLEGNMITINPYLNDDVMDLTSNKKREEKHRRFEADK